MHSKETRSVRNSIVFGGASGLGRALVESLAARGDRVLASARDIRDLEALQRDCAVRFGTHVNIEAIDVSSADFDADVFVDRCVQVLGHITNVFLPIGAISIQDKSPADRQLIQDLATVNYIRPAQLLTAFCAHFENNGRGHAMIFSSIATAAPRSNNTAYASAKAALEFYCRGLQHHFAGSPISIQICILGYVDTSMSFGLKLRFPVTSPKAAAEYALRLSETDARVAYFPRFWSLVTGMLKLLPGPFTGGCVSNGANLCSIRVWSGHKSVGHRMVVWQDRILSKIQVPKTIPSQPVSIVRALTKVF